MYPIPKLYKDHRTMTVGDGLALYIKVGTLKAQVRAPC